MKHFSKIMVLNSCLTLILFGVISGASLSDKRFWTLDRYLEQANFLVYHNFMWVLRLSDKALDTVQEDGIMTHSIKRKGYYLFSFPFHGTNLIDHVKASVVVTQDDKAEEYPMVYNGSQFISSNEIAGDSFEYHYKLTHKMYYKYGDLKLEFINVEEPFNGINNFFSTNMTQLGAAIDFKKYSSQHFVFYTPRHFEREDITKFMSLLESLYNFLDKKSPFPTTNKIRIMNANVKKIKHVYTEAISFHEERPYLFSDDLECEILIAQQMDFSLNVIFHSVIDVYLGKKESVLGEGLAYLLGNSFDMHHLEALNAYLSEPGDIGYNEIHENNIYRFNHPSFTFAFDLIQEDTYIPMTDLFARTEFNHTISSAYDVNTRQLTSFTFYLVQKFGMSKVIEKIRKDKTWEEVFAKSLIELEEAYLRELKIYQNVKDSEVEIEPPFWE